MSSCSAGVGASTSRSVADAAGYIALTRELLGPHAATPQRLRIGASALLDVIEALLDGPPHQRHP